MYDHRPSGYPHDLKINTSSRAIYYHMTGTSTRPVEGWPDIPTDAKDFGCCRVLLKRHPEWVKRMPEMAKRVPMNSARNKAWGMLTPHWDQLTALYDEVGAVRAMRKMMNRLLNGEAAPTPSRNTMGTLSRSTSGTISCPKCDENRVKVAESRVSKRIAGYRRRRVCLACKHAWTTIEIPIESAQEIDRIKKVLDKFGFQLPSTPATPPRQGTP